VVERRSGGGNPLGGGARTARPYSAVKGMERKRLHAAVRAMIPPRWCPLRFSPFGEFLFERGEPDWGFPKGEN
jgi:hypothetical protein